MLVAAAVLLAQEKYWRSEGLQPSVVDSPDLWSVYRSRASNRRTNTVALVGTSRMQVGFSRAVMESEYPKYEVLNLAIGGARPVAVLADLAKDEGFLGLVICEMTPEALLREHRYEQSHYVDAYRNRSSWERNLDNRWSAWIQERFVVVSPHVRIQKLLQGEWPDPTWLIARADRSFDAYFNLRDEVKWREQRSRRRNWARKEFEVAPDPWLTQALEVGRFVKKIQDRGGKVVFVAFPMTGEIWAKTEARFPKSEYWDRFAGQINTPCIHFRDYPALRAFECPDFNHIDASDKNRFSLELCKILESHGILGPPDAEW